MFFYLENLSTHYDISLQTLCKEHLQALEATLREPDRQEMWACYRLPARDVLQLCAQRSTVAVAFLYRGKVCAVSGVEGVSLLGNRGCVWSWTGEGVLVCPKSFVRASKQVLAYFRILYPALYAACDVRYRTAQRYLQHLGAQRCGQAFYLAGQETQFIWYQWQ